MRTVASSIVIDRPVEAVYDLWQRPEELARLTDGVTDVKRLGDDRHRWRAVIGHERREWESRVVERVPNRLLAWDGDGAFVHGGSVAFAPLDGDRTRVSVHVDWEPGGLFDKVGDRLGLVQRQLEQDLAAIKRAAEQRGSGASAAVSMRRVGDRKDGDTGTRQGGTGGGTGRTADSPTEIPPTGWLQVLKRTFKEAKRDNAPIVSAGVAFYLFLALAPTLVAFIALYGLLASTDEVVRQVESFTSALPSAAAGLITDLVASIVSKPETGLGVSFAISVLAALWSASKGMQAIITALNIAYNEDETRKFLKLRALALLLTVGFSVAAVGAIAGMVAVARAAESLGSGGRWAATILRWPVLGLGMIAALAVLHRYAPNRDNPRWRWVTPGAILSTVLLLLATIGFSLYVSYFGKFDESYGPLGAVVVLLLWLFLSAYIVVLGAEFDSEAERQTVRDTTEGPQRPMGRRDAYAADTVAA